MDRRVKYTLKIIEETFLNLLEEKDISNITVTEICNIADINRATFYRYYIDIYDLLKKIEGNFIDKIKNSTPIENISEYTVYKFSYEILDIFINNKKLVKILFNTNHNIYFMNEVLEIAYNKCVDIWSSRLNNNDDIEIQYAGIFVFNGALGIINYWVKNDFDKDIEEVARSIEQFTIRGINKFLIKI